MTENFQPASAGTAELCLPQSLRKPRLRSDAASQYLAAVHGVSVSKKTLDKMRSIGGGPHFQKAGRSALYPKTELDRWAARRLGPVRVSTSDVDGR